MKQHSRNILVLAENNGNRPGFNIYLVFSGQREYLFTHRHNGALYDMLKDGICLADLERGVRDMNLPAVCGRRSGKIIKYHLQNSMRYLLDVIDEYVEDRELYA